MTDTQQETRHSFDMAPFQVETAIADLTQWKIPEELGALFNLKDQNKYWHQVTEGNKDILFSTSMDDSGHSLKDANVVITISKRPDQDTHERLPFEITVAGIVQTSQKKKMAISVGYSLLDGGITALDLVIPTDSDSLTDLAFYAKNKLTKESKYPLDYAGNITEGMVRLVNDDKVDELILMRGYDPKYKHDISFFEDELNAEKNNLTIKNGKGMTLFENGSNGSWIGVPSNLIL